MLYTAPTRFDGKSRASCHVAAVNQAAVFYAGLSRDFHRGGASCNPTCDVTMGTAQADALVARGKAKTARNKTLSSDDVPSGIPKSFNRMCAMLGTDTACLSKSGAAFLLAHFPAATAVLSAPASGLDGSGALVEGADLLDAIFAAKSSYFSDAAAAFCGTRHCLAVVFQTLASHTNGLGDARVRCAVSKGAMLAADTLAGDFRGGAALLLAQCPAATAVLAAPASGFDGTGALVERAEAK